MVNTYREEVYIECLKMICSRLNETYSTSTINGNLDNQIRPVYRNELKNLLETGYWMFPLKSHPLVQYEDEQGGYHIPPNYVLFCFLGSKYNTCSVCKSQHNRGTFDMYIMDGRLQTMNVSCCDLCTHTHIYYLSSDFQLSEVKGSFMDALCLKIVLAIGASKGLSYDNLKLYQTQLETLMKTGISKTVDEFTPAFNKKPSTRVENSYGRRNTNGKYFI